MKKFIFLLIAFFALSMNSFAKTGDLYDFGSWRGYVDGFGNFAPDIRWDGILSFGSVNGSYKNNTVTLTIDSIPYSKKTCKYFIYVCRQTSMMNMAEWRYYAGCIEDFLYPSRDQVDYNDYYSTIQSYCKNLFNVDGRGSSKRFVSTTLNSKIWEDPDGPLFDNMHYKNTDMYDNVKNVTMSYIICEIPDGVDNMAGKTINVYYLHNIITNSSGSATCKFSDLTLFDSMKLLDNVDTSVENISTTTTSPKVVKKMENGHIVIYKDGHKYNTNGSELR